MSFTREILGSNAFINKHLAPKDKPSNLFFWTGEANAPPQAVKLAYKSGLLNINGGETKRMYKRDSITEIGPMGVEKSGYYQVYTPQANDYIFTNRWRGPYYGFQNVIHTYKLTNDQRRYKPIDIYYHFYSATKQASLRALKKVYRWAEQQKTTNVFISQYIRRVLGYRHAVIAKEGDHWLITNKGHLRELRWPDSLPAVSVQHSQGVIGKRQSGKGRYLHLAPQGPVRLYAQKTNMDYQPYLVSANGVVTSASKHDNGGLKQLVIAEQPSLKVRLANMQGCQLITKHPIKHQETSDGTTISYRIMNQDQKDYALSIQCR
jgi:hypothetical protein